MNRQQQLDSFPGEQRLTFKKYVSYKQRIYDRYVDIMFRW